MFRMGEQAVYVNRSGIRELVTVSQPCGDLASVTFHGDRDPRYVSAARLEKVAGSVNVGRAVTFILSGSDRAGTIVEWIPAIGGRAAVAAVRETRRAAGLLTVPAAALAFR